VSPSPGITVDLSRHPLVSVRIGSAYGNAEWSQMLLDLIQIFARGPFVVIADLRRAQLPNAVQRRSFIAMYEDHDRLTRTNFLALGAVGDSIVLQRLITVLDWIRPAPHPVKVVNTTAAAEAWALEHLPEPVRQRVPPARSRSKG
jgi:hypothetical protein